MSGQCVVRLRETRPVGQACSALVLDWAILCNVRSATAAAAAAAAAVYSSSTAAAAAAAAVQRRIWACPACLAEQGTHKRGPHRPENVGQQRDILWPVWAIYVVLRHTKVHLVQRDTLACKVKLCYIIVRSKA